MRSRRGRSKGHERAFLADLVTRAEVAGTRLTIHGGLRVDHPVVVNGDGQLILHEDVWLGFSLAPPTAPTLLQPREAESVIEVGRGTAIMNGTRIVARDRIVIGERCLIGAEVVIYDSDFHDVALHARSSPGASKPTIVHNDVWIGDRAMILKGVEIGHGSVIAAGAIVTKAVPPMTVVAGNPANPVGIVPA